MQITVFGASGKVGRLVVTELLAKNYQVVAFVHSQSNLPADKNLKFVRGDVHQSVDVAEAIKGSQVVISTLGSWHSKHKDIVSSAIESLIPAMNSQGISRIISLTGSDALATNDRPKFVSKIMRPLLKIVAGKILSDGEKHIQLLETSSLNYTVVRSPVMRSFGKAGNFKLSNQPNNIWDTINRQNVALAICSLIDDHTFDRSCPFVG